MFENQTILELLQGLSWNSSLAIMHAQDSEETEAELYTRTALEYQQEILKRFSELEEYKEMCESIAKDRNLMD